MSRGERTSSNPLYGTRHEVPQPTTFREVRKDGTICWHNRAGQLHREGGPAMLLADGAELEDGYLDGYLGIKGPAQLWFSNGELDREEGPAIIVRDGTELWFRAGKMHRDNGPAATYPWGLQEWFQNGELDRADGPAIVHEDGTEKWLRHGKLHREEGPAVHVGPSEEYMRLPGGAKIWGPADAWYLDDKLHRDDGPAVIQEDGTEWWLRHGKLHREDGPAVEYDDETTSNEWWLDGQELSEQEWRKRTSR